LPVRRWRRKQVAVVVGVAIAVILIALFVLFKSSANRGKSPGTPAAPDKATQTPTVMAAYVVSKEVERQLKLPGELNAYQDVALYPKVQGFVEEVNVDRGSVVKRGQLLVRMSAPELSSQTSEADARVRAAQQQQIELEARVRSAREQRAEAVAKLASDDGTYRRLKAASATPGVVAENDVDVAEKNVEADTARIRLLEENEKAAQAVVRSQLEDQKAAKSAARSVRDIESYLRINAPFVGVITERNVDPGSLAGPSGGPSSPRCCGSSRFPDCGSSSRFRKRTWPALRPARVLTSPCPLIPVRLSAAWSCGSVMRWTRRPGRCRSSWT